MAYRLTNQKEIRREFWWAFPKLKRKKMGDGNFVCDTRCAFVNYVDMLQRDGTISEALAAWVTL